MGETDPSPLLPSRTHPIRRIPKRVALSRFRSLLDPRFLSGFLLREVVEVQGQLESAQHARSACASTRAASLSSSRSSRKDTSSTSTFSTSPQEKNTSPLLENILERYEHYSYAEKVLISVDPELQVTEKRKEARQEHLPSARVGATTMLFLTALFVPMD